MEGLGSFYSTPNDYGEQKATTEGAVSTLFRSPTFLMCRCKRPSIDLAPVRGTRAGIGLR